MNNWSKGNAWYRAKDFKGAYVYYKKALQEDPSNPEILKKIGNTLYNLEDYPKAINYYDRVIKVKPSASLWANKGNALFNLQEYEKAIFCYKKALEEKPSTSHVHSEILENSGDALVNLERYEEAINDYYDRAIKIMSNAEAIRQKRSWAYILLGNKHRNNKKYLDAVNCYDEAIKFKPSANLWLKKGNAWFSNAQEGSKLITSDCDQAKDCYMKALKIDPNFYKALIKLGDVSLFLQEADNAVDYYRRTPTIYLSSYEDNYKKALSLKADQENKDKLTDLIAKGNNAYNDDNLSNAKKYYDELLKYEHSKFPFGENEIKVLKGLAKHCNTTKEYEQAILYTEKVRDLRQNDIDNLYQRVKAYTLSGNTLISQQKYVDAINRYNKALAAKPDNGFILQIKLCGGHLLLSSIDQQSENDTTILRIARDMIQIINRFETNIPPINFKEFANDPDIADCRLVDNLNIDKIKSLAEDFISKKCISSEWASKSELSVKQIVANPQQSQKLKRKAEEQLKPNNEKKQYIDMPSLNKNYNTGDTARVESSKSFKEKFKIFQAEKISANLPALPTSSPLALQEVSYPNCDLTKLSSFRYKKHKHKTYQIQPDVLDTSVEGINELFQWLDSIKSDQGLWAEAYVFLFLLNYYKAKYGAEKVTAVDEYKLIEPLDNDQEIKTFSTAFRIKGSKKPGKEIQIMWFNYDAKHKGKGNRDIDVRKISKESPSKDYYIEVKSHQNKTDVHTFTKSEVALMLKVLEQQNQKYRVYQVDNVNKAEQELSINIKASRLENSLDIYNRAKTFKLKI